MSPAYTILIPKGPVIGPALFAILLFGIRYLGLVGFFFILSKLGKGRVIQSDRHHRSQARREIGFSSLTILIFGFINIVLCSYGIIEHSFLYLNISEYGWLWFWISIPIMLVLHDAIFYWLHRLLHWQRLYSSVHYLHHQSLQTTTWTTYSLHPWEAAIEAIALTIIIFILPVHPLAFLLFQSISTLLNAYCHCGLEFFPHSWTQHWLGRWINTSAMHAIHHETGTNNYGLYFLFWDRRMRTVSSLQSS